MLYEETVHKHVLVLVLDFANLILIPRLKSHFPLLCCLFMAHLVGHFRIQHYNQ